MLEEREADLHDHLRVHELRQSDGLPGAFRRHRHHDVKNIERQRCISSARAGADVEHR